MQNNQLTDFEDKAIEDGPSDGAIYAAISKRDMAETEEEKLKAAMEYSAAVLRARKQREVK